MDLLTKLATQCVQVKEAYDPGLEDVRRKFEGSVGREKAFRGHAQRMTSRAESEAEENDPSLGASLQAAGGRLVPVPHSMGEAAWRLPAILGAGAVGAHYGGQVGTPPEVGGAHIQEALHDPKVRDHIVARTQNPEINAINKVNPTSPEQAAALLDKLKAHSADALAQGVRPKPTAMGIPLPHAELPFTHAGPKAIRKTITDAMGHGGLGVMHEALRGGGAGVAGHVAESAGHIMPSMHKALGGLGGLALGAVATGLPLAAATYWNKRHRGGDAAVDARNEAADAASRGDKEQTDRARMLSKLQKASSIMDNLHKIDVVKMKNIQGGLTRLRKTHPAFTEHFGPLLGVQNAAPPS